MPFTPTALGQHPSSYLRQSFLIGFGLLCSPNLLSIMPYSISSVSRNQIITDNLQPCQTINTIPRRLSLTNLQPMTSPFHSGTTASTSLSLQISAGLVLSVGKQKYPPIFENRLRWCANHTCGATYPLLQRHVRP